MFDCLSTRTKVLATAAVAATVAYRLAEQQEEVKLIEAAAEIPAIEFTEL